MAKKPLDRYQTAQAMVDDLIRALPDAAVTKSVSNAVRKERRPEKRGVWYGAAAVVLALAGLLAYNLLQPVGGTPGAATAVSTITLTSQPTDEPQPIAAVTEPPAAPAVATDTASPAPVLPSPTITAVPATATATTTAVPPTAASTATIESIESPLIAQLETITTDVSLYGGPSAQNVVLGLLARGVVVEALGKVDNASWYEVRTEAGKEGWVDAGQVAFVSGTSDDVAVTWPRAANTPLPGTAVSPAPVPFCSGVTVERDVLGNFHVLWTSYPPAADHLWLSVYGAASGDPLVYPNDIDQNDPDWEENGYTIGKWLFEQRGFPQNTTYQYVMKAIDAAGAEICSVSGSFVN